MSHCLLDQLLPPQTSRKTPPNAQAKPHLHVSVTTAEHRAGSGSKPFISKSNPCSRGRTAGMSSAQWEWNLHGLHIPKPTCPSPGAHLYWQGTCQGTQTSLATRAAPSSTGMHPWQLWDDGTVVSSLPPSPETPPRGRICPPSHEASLTEESLLLTHPSFPLFSSNTSDHPVPGQSTSIRAVDQDP